MPHDFGSFGSRDRRSGSASASGIGFHELRQACEISTLREDVERLAHEAATLRDRVEEAVEDIRDRFAALSAEQLTDAAAMAPLLQVAVTTLLDIREQTRRLNTRTGPLPDDDRSSWLAAADAPPVRPSAAAPPCAPAPPAQPLPPEEPAPVARAASPFPVPPPHVPDAVPPVPAAPAAPAASGPGPGAPSASWLAARPSPTPPPSRAAATRSGGPSPVKPGGIDWLGPAGR
ncbi:hypothetical protein J2847_000666 [Azospirillum agricola]|uniref:hypothetical protein n=1 Tax=Azospirillum agricola TaxID=1720247 RepID=UPI001F1DC7B3|nr:hypothetical protein [Azospirillum agricola]MBP2227386.1 hypothetical protein [Azospirillum agricola]